MTWHAGAGWQSDIGYPPDFMATGVVDPMDAQYRDVEALHQQGERVSRYCGRT